jgi:hypothetical protein
VPLLVVWEQRDSFDGEDEPPVAFDRLGIRAYPAGFGFTLSLRLRNIAPRDKAMLWPSPRNLLEPKQASRRPISSCA